MPSINALEKELAGHGFRVLLVDLWERPEQVRATVMQRGYTLPVAIDADGAVSKAYGVRATPTVFLIGRDGTLLGEAIGPRSWTAPSGRALLDSLLGPP